MKPWRRVFESFRNIESLSSEFPIIIGLHQEFALGPYTFDNG